MLETMLTGNRTRQGKPPVLKEITVNGAEIYLRQGGVFEFTPAT